MPSRYPFRRKNQRLQPRRFKEIIIASKRKIFRRHSNLFEHTPGAIAPGLLGGAIAGEVVVGKVLGDGRHYDVNVLRAVLHHSSQCHEGLQGVEALRDDDTVIVNVYTAIVGRTHGDPDRTCTRAMSLLISSAIST